MRFFILASLFYSGLLYAAEVDYKFNESYAELSQLISRFQSHNRNERFKEAEKTVIEIEAVRLKMYDLAESAKHRGTKKRLSTRVRSADRQISKGVYDRLVISPDCKVFGKSHEEVFKNIARETAFANSIEWESSKNSEKLFACLEYSLKAGVSPDTPINDGGDTAMLWAAYNQSIRVIELLVKHGATIDLENRSRDFYSPMALAAFYGNCRTVRRMLN